MRMLMLGVPALREAVADRTGPEAIPLFLGLPEAYASHGAAFIASLAQAAQVNVDLAASEAICAGRAAGLFALEQALEFLARGAGNFVLVGGVDTYLDDDVLLALDAEDRLQGEGVSDGFIPGEGAGFLLLGATGASAQARIAAIGLGSESGHRYSDQPYRGDGLAQAVREVFRRDASAHAPVRSVYAGYNGENFWAKEWGVAYLRNRERFAEAFRFEHPADCFGDLGAALGPVLIGLAATGIAKGYRAAPCLVWCSSDREARGAALVTANTP
jgi:3-oxoacyl-[acyl-carrier-protein] synthase-1